jgi:tRNA threonylcarbamoyladenosine biosynthesis protein TsaB
MLTLSLNTAFSALEGAVLDGDTCLAEQRAPMQRGQDAALAGFVRGLLAEAGLALGDLDRLAVVTGPGSFTGIRIGVSYMRGLALVLDVPCVGLTSIESAVSPEVIGPVFGGLQAQKRPPDQTWWVQDLSAGYGTDTPRELSREETLQRLADFSGSVFVSGHAGLLPELGAKAMQDLVPSAIIAGRKAQSVTPASHPPSPVYARAPDAALPKPRETAPKRALIVLRPDDAGAMARLHAAGFPEAWSAAAFRDLLKEPGVLALGMQQAGTLCGFALTRSVADESDLLTIVTDVSRLRGGIAASLVKALETRLGERGVSRWTLDVAEDNLPAIQLYQKAGFAEDGRRAGYYTSGRNKPVDAILMSRRLGL